MDMKKILQAVDGASSKKSAEGSSDMKKFMQIVEGKGPLNRLTAAESMAMQTSAKKKTITNPVLNVKEDAKPSMIGKYFKTVQEELLEAEQRHKERASQLAQRVIERVTFDPVTGERSPSFADQMKASGAQPSPEPASSATLPGKDLPKAEKADRQSMTVTVAGQEYKMVMLEPGGIRPRGGQRIAIPQAVMGERGIGNYIGILAGSTVYVLPRGEQESVEQLSEELEQLFDLRNKIEEAIKQRLDPKCWKGKKIGNPKTKVKGGVRVNNCVPAESIEEDKRCPQCGSTTCTCPPGKCKCKPVKGWLTKKVKEASSPAQQAAIAVNMKKAGKKPKSETVQKTGTAGQLRGTDKVDVKGTVLGSPEKSQKGLRNKLVGGGA